MDRNGTLDYGEVVAISIHLKRIGNDGHLRKAFRYFDQDDSGYIEIEELRGCLADDLGPNHDEVIYAIICDVDTDKVCISYGCCFREHAGIQKPNLD